MVGCSGHMLVLKGASLENIVPLGGSIIPRKEKRWFSINTVTAHGDLPLLSPNNLGLFVGPFQDHPMTGPRKWLYNSHGDRFRPLSRATWDPFQIG